ILTCLRPIELGTGGDPVEQVFLIARIDEDARFDKEETVRPCRRSAGRFSHGGQELIESLTAMVSRRLDSDGCIGLVRRSRSQTAASLALGRYAGCARSCKRGPVQFADAPRT